MANYYAPESSFISPDYDAPERSECEAWMCEECRFSTLSGGCSEGLAPIVAEIVLIDAEIKCLSDRGKKLERMDDKVNECINHTAELLKLAA